MPIENWKAQEASWCCGGRLRVGRGHCGFVLSSRLLGRVVAGLLGVVPQPPRYAELEPRGLVRRWRGDSGNVILVSRLAGGEAV